MNLLSRPYQRVLREVDVFAKDIHDSLAARNLTDIVDVVFVSDHGMTDTSHPELIYVDDILGDGFKMIEHEDGLFNFSPPPLPRVPLIQVLNPVVLPFSYHSCSISW